MSSVSSRCSGAERLSQFDIREQPGGRRIELRMRCSRHECTALEASGERWGFSAALASLLCHPRSDRFDSAVRASHWLRFLAAAAANCVRANITCSIHRLLHILQLTTAAESELNRPKQHSRSQKAAAAAHVEEEKTEDTKALTQHYPHTNTAQSTEQSTDKRGRTEGAGRRSVHRVFIVVFLVVIACVLFFPDEKL